jgi:Glycosyltransferase family 87
VKGRLARLLLGVVSGLVLVLAAVVDLPRATDGRFWSDGATYHAMAGSLAFDRDLEFTATDLARVKAAYPGGPQGVFLKRVHDPAGSSRLVYAKAVAYPALAAPFARLFGTDRGLLLLNALAFLVALWLVYGELGRKDASPSAAAGALALVGLGVAPVYLLWQTPELVNLALATAGLVAYRRDRPYLAAVLLGLAVYSKPTHLALALPLVAAPLVGAGGTWAGRSLEGARRGVLLVAVAAAGFGLGWLATGELNYQGGERKTFYDSYPFEPGVTFDSAGVWMTTDHVGPLVAGRDEHMQPDRVAPPRAVAELRRSFLLNLGYFWVGRFGGALAYFPGLVAAVLLFLLPGPRDRDGWLAIAALAAAWVGTILLIPDNWYGGGGTVGNRYLLGFLALGLLILPRGRAGWAAAFAAAVTAVFLAPVLASPIQHSLRPGEHATRAAFRVLPAELTMLGDLSVFTDVWRKRRPYRGYFLWFLDDSTFGQETSFDAEGFWLRGGQAGEVVLQAPARAERIRLRVTAGPAGDIVTARIGSMRQRVVLPPLKSGEIVFEAPHATLGYYGSPLYLLRLGSRYGGATPTDERKLGSFLVLEVQAP